MEVTTTCYIEKDDKYLMLHRIKKENDINEGKWIGVGGHVEEGESPTEAIIREVREETGLILNSCRLRGVLTFVQNKTFTEYIFLYTSDEYSGELIEECDEGVLGWIDKDKVIDINIWDGDRIFLDMLRTTDEFFSIKYEYEGDKLISYKVE